MADQMKYGTNYEVRHDAGSETVGSESAAEAEAKRLEEKYGYDTEIVEVGHDE